MEVAWRCGECHERQYGILARTARGWLAGDPPAPCRAVPRSCLRTWIGQRLPAFNQTPPQPPPQPLTPAAPHCCCYLRSCPSACPFRLQVSHNAMLQSARSMQPLRMLFRMTSSSTKVAAPGHSPNVTVCTQHPSAVSCDSSRPSPWSISPTLPSTCGVQGLLSVQTQGLSRWAEV